MNPFWAANDCSGLLVEVGEMEVVWASPVMHWIVFIFMFIMQIRGPTITNLVALCSSSLLALRLLLPIPSSAHSRPSPLSHLCSIVVVDGFVALKWLQVQTVPPPPLGIAGGD